MEKKIILDGREIVGDLTSNGKSVEISLKNQSYNFELVSLQGDLLVVQTKDGQRRHLHVSRSSTGQMLIDFEGRNFALEESQGRMLQPKHHDIRPRAPMPGKIMKILKQKGELVKKGDPLIIMEAMKMEHTIRAGRDGKIKEIFCRPGDLVAGGMDLLDYEIEVPGET